MTILSASFANATDIHSYNANYHPILQFIRDNNYTIKFFVQTDLEIENKFGF